MSARMRAVVCSSVLVSEMIAPEGRQHRFIPVRVKDSVENDVVAVIQRISRHLVDQPDVCAAGPVFLLEDCPADHVLRYPGDAISISRPQGPRHRAFP